MIRLVGVEVRRALARRLVRVLLALAVVTIAVAGTAVFVTSSSEFDRRSQLAEARARYARDLAECRRLEPGAPCERFIGTVEDRVHDKRFHLTDVREGLLGASSILFVTALAAAASFVGADWRHGTVATLLTWEPRRTRVLLAKVAASVALAAVIAVILQALLVGAMLPAALLRGVTSGADAAWWQSTLGLGLRIAALTALATVVGLAVASLARNSAAAAGVAFLYFAVLEGIVRGLRPGWQRWLVGDNAATFLVGGLERPPLPGRTSAEAGLYLAACTAAVLAAAAVSFRHRDIT